MGGEPQLSQVSFLKPALQTCYKYGLQMILARHNEFFRIRTCLAWASVLLLDLLPWLSLPTVLNTCAEFSILCALGGHMIPQAIYTEPLQDEITNVSGTRADTP